MARAVTLLGLCLGATGCFHARPYSATSTQAKWRAMNDSDASKSTRGATAHAGGAHLTAEQAYAMALERNFEVTAQSASADAAAANVDAARQIENPQLRLTNINVDDIIANNGCTSSPFRTCNPVVTIGLRVPIPRPGSVRARVAGAKQIAQGEASATEDAKRQLRAEIDKLFAQLAVHRADIDNAQRSRAMQLAHRDDIAARSERAVATRVDLAMAELRLAEAIQTEAELDDAITSIEGQLRLMIGATEPVEFVTDDATLEVVSTPMDKDALIDRALASRPELRGAHAGIEAAESEAYIAKNEAWPWFEWAQLQYRAGPDSQPSAFGFGVAISLPVFSWNRGAIRAAKAVVRQREQEQRAQILTIAAEVNEAATRVERTAKRIDTIERELLPQLDTANREIEAAIASGAYDPDAINDIARRSLEARRMHLEAVLAHREAVIDLEAAVGGSIRATKGGAE